MRSFLFFIFLVLNFQYAVCQNINKINNDYEKLISSDIKALNIAKANKDSNAISQVLSNIMVNQKLFDTLIVAQINEYLKYTEAYKSNLQSKDSLKVYENNLLNYELHNKLISKNNFISNDSGKHKNNLETKTKEIFIESIDIPLLSVFCNNNSTYFIKACISILNENNYSLFKKIIEIKPKDKNNIISFEPLYFINSKSKYYYTVAIIFLNSNDQYYYTYSKSKLISIKNNLEIEINNENSANENYRLATPEILKEFNISTKVNSNVK